MRTAAQQAHAKKVNKQAIPTKLTMPPFRTLNERLAWDKTEEGKRFAARQSIPTVSTIRHETY